MSTIIASSAVGQGKVFTTAGGGSVPSGWYGVGFNDSSWASPVLQTSYTPPGAPIAGSQLITDTTSARSGQPYYDLFRATFNVSSLSGAFVFTAAADDIVTALYINGTAVSFSAAGQVSVPIPSGLLSVGSNLVAVQVKDTIASYVSVSWVISNPFSVISGAQSGKQPLFLATILAADGDVCYLTSKTYYGGSGLVYNGNTYLPRIQQNDIEAIQATGPQGYSGVPGFQLTISDADKFIWTNHCYPHGWAGAAVTLTVITWDLIANAYSTNSLSWSFLGSNPSHNYAAGQTVIKTVSAINFARLKVPSAPVSTLCIWDFPVHYVDRVNGAFNFTSNFWQDGYGPDVANYYVGNLIAKGTCSALTASLMNTTFTYTSGSGTVPSVLPFQATIDQGANTVCEEVLVTGISGSTWTVVRAQWNTILASHGAGSNVYVPYTSCQLIRSSYANGVTQDPSIGCMARLGDVSDTSISVDGNLLRDVAGNYTGHFGGNTWLAPTQYSGVQYTSGQKQLGFNSQNASLAGSYYNFIYGTQWVNGAVLAPAGDPNSIRSEVVVCIATQYGINVQKVLVNGVQIPGGGGDVLFTWRPIQYPSMGQVPNPPLEGFGSWFYGGRQGAINRDAIYNTSGTPGPDPHGSMGIIEVVVPQQLGSINSVQVLATGPPTIQCCPIATTSSSGGELTVTLSAGVPDLNIGPNSPVHIAGNSLWNGGAIVDTASYGPPGVVTLKGTYAAGSGTGGTLFYYHPPDLYDGNASGACNVVWAYLDLMTWGNVDLNKIDGLSWYNAAQFCATQISYTGADGTLQNHAAFKASFALNGTQQQVLAAVLTGLGNAGNLLVGANSSNGLIQCYIKQTLADQQPSAITGSNYNTPVPSETFYFQGAWQSGGPYITGNQVEYLGITYVNNTGTNTSTPPPSDTTNWTAISQPTGYYAYYFNETNIEVGSFRVVTTDLQETPNAFASQFQDELNGYVVDSINVIDPAAYAFSGNQEVNVPIPIIGAPNFDQLQRVGNTKIAEALYGNPRNDAGGTLYFEFSINVQIIGLASRIGFICGLTWQALGIGTGTYPQAVRVLTLKPDTDGEHWAVRCAWHSDNWYTYAYGQNPTPFQNNPLLNPPQRPPYPWMAGQPVTGFAGNPLNLAASFQLNLNTATYPAQLTLSGYLPVNAQPQMLPPLVPLQATTASTGGSLTAGVWHIAISANGAQGPVSGSNLNTFITAVVPTGTSTNTVTVSGIQWQSGAAADVEVYFGRDSQHMVMLTAGNWTGSNNDTNGNPTTIKVTASGGILGLPDTVFQEFAILQTGIAHGGVWGDTIYSIAGAVLTFPEASWTTNQFAGRVLTNYYSTHFGTRQVSASSTVVSNTATTLTLSSAVGFNPGDVAVMRTLATTYTASTIGDSNFINSYTPSGMTVNGEIGRTVQIISGTGAGTSPKPVASNTSTVLTINGTFDVTPDATSVFIVLYPGQASMTSNLISNSSVAATSGYVLPVATVPAATLVAQSMLIQVATADSNGNYGPLQYQPFREVFIPAQTVPGGSINPGYYTITVSGGVAIIDLANGLVQRIVGVSSTAVTVNPPIFTGGALASGLEMTLLYDQPSSGAAAPIPTFSTSSGGFDSTVGGWQIDGTNSTRTTYQFRDVNSTWTLQVTPPVTGGPVT